MSAKRRAKIRQAKICRQTNLQRQKHFFKIRSPQKIRALTSTFLPFLFLIVFGCRSQPTQVRHPDLSPRISTIDSTLVQPKYEFDLDIYQDRILAAKDAFRFSRSFVDYYYLLVLENKQQIPLLGQFQKDFGYCVGDAHPENFGFLIQKNQKPIFTMNDTDDFGRCPQFFDFLRLLVTSHLWNEKLNLKKISQAYLEGLLFRSRQLPKTLKSLQSESQKNGVSVAPHKVKNEEIVQTSETQAADASSFSEIAGTLLKTFPDLSILEIQQVFRKGGGSGGLLRFEILAKNKNELLLLELKEQINAAVSPTSGGQPLSSPEKIERALKLEQNSLASEYYKVLRIRNRWFLLRPDFAGNMSARLTQMSLADAQEIINYEAYWLGNFHARTAEHSPEYLSKLQSTSFAEIEKVTKLFSDFFRLKFKELKSPPAKETPSPSEELLPQQTPAPVKTSEPITPKPMAPEPQVQKAARPPDSPTPPAEPPVPADTDDFN